MNSSWPSMRLVVSRRGPAVTCITVFGVIDALTVESLAACVHDVLRQRPALIELDLTAVRLVDATTARELVRLHGRAQDAGCSLIITGAQKPTWWLLEYLGLDVMFPQRARHRQPEPGG
jgi:anti-anti-sigma factor